MLLLSACATRGVPNDTVASSSGARVALLVVDGLDARDVSDAEMPTLARAWRESRWCPGVHARAAMPARTNVNHATLLTGVSPEIHGVTGNAFWNRTNEPPRKLGAAPDLLTETLFTVAHAHVPPLRTAAALGKAKLALMFTATPTGQVGPTRVWSPSDAPSGGRDPATGYAFDAATLAGARAVLEDAPAFVFVNLADIDRVSHGFGPHSPEARATRSETDRLLGEFVNDVLRRPEWRAGTIVVTADHGFDATTQPIIDVAARVRAAGLDDTLVSVADGGVAHVYAREPGTARAAAALAEARRLMLATPGVADALYREPNPADDGDAHLLARVHPEWGLTHPRSGDLILIASPGYALAGGREDEIRLKGNHGATGERDVPVIALGTIGAGPQRCDDVTAADLGRTLLGCLGLRDVARIDGGSIAPDTRGRMLAGLCVTPSAAAAGR
jgi:hypothetical protein